MVKTGFMAIFKENCKTQSKDLRSLGESVEQEAHLANNRRRIPSISWSGQIFSINSLPQNSVFLSVSGVFFAANRF
jgi:hypothetical protein